MSEFYLVCKSGLGVVPSESGAYQPNLMQFDVWLPYLDRSFCPTCVEIPRTYLKIGPIRVLIVRYFYFFPTIVFFNALYFHGLCVFVSIVLVHDLQLDCIEEVDGVSALSSYGVCSLAEEINLFPSTHSPFACVVL